MTKINLDTVGEFVWDFGQRFHITTNVGCFEWSDPDYGGDNTIRPCSDFATWIGDSFGRDKGTRRIGDKCGNQVKFVNCE